MKNILMALALAAPASAFGEMLNPTPMSQQPLELQNFLNTMDKGCILEGDFYRMYNQLMGSQLALDPGKWGYSIGKTYTTAVAEPILGAYGAVNKMPAKDAREYAKPCKGLEDPRDLAGCLAKQADRYVQATGESKLGGSCKLFSTYVNNLAAQLGDSVRSSSLAPGWGHALNKVTITGKDGVQHTFLIDAIQKNPTNGKPFSFELADRNGECPGRPGALGAPARVAEAQEKLGSRKVVAPQTSLDHMVEGFQWDTQVRSPAAKPVLTR
ncbi:MAG: hypothetical protein WC728_16630 [Elusimicrobiota bacterium]